jgi:adenylate kinase
MRKEPNIVITGTPGVGKTAHCEQLATNTRLTHIPINQFAEEHDCYDGRDEELGSWIVDEDKVSSPDRNLSLDICLFDFK